MLIEYKAIENKQLSNLIKPYSKVQNMKFNCKQFFITTAILVTALAAYLFFSTIINAIASI